MLSLLHSFEYFVDARDSSELTQGRELSSLSDQIEWNDGDEVDEEPASQVGASNEARVVDQFLARIIKGGLEGEDDIEEEDQVSHILDDLPLQLVILHECNTHWCYDRSEDNRAATYPITYIKKKISQRTFHGSSGRIMQYL